MFDSSLDACVYTALGTGGLGLTQPPSDADPHGGSLFKFNPPPKKIKTLLPSNIPFVLASIQLTSPPLFLKRLLVSVSSQVNMSIIAGHIGALGKINRTPL